MQRYLLILGGLLALVVAPALADQVIYYAPEVIGKRARSEIRYYLYAKNLTGDKKVIFDEYGYTPHRLRTDYAGRVTESWKYLDDGVEFVFDQHGNIIDERRIEIEHRRDWVNQ